MNGIICATCLLFHRNCPLAGMTNTVDEPLEGYIVACIHYKPTNPFTNGNTSLRCHRCGNPNIIYESPAEGYYCPLCGSSDQDE